MPQRHRHTQVRRYSGLLRKPGLVLSGVVAVLIGLVGAVPAAAETTSGWNDWSCQPSAQHPEPVVLVHGAGVGGVSNWFYHAPKLVEQGYCVFSLDYGTNSLGINGTTSMRDSAAELGVYVDKVLAATGAAEVSMVGHSEGTTMPAYYLKFGGGAAKVAHFVGFGANYHGTTLNGLDTLATTLLDVLPGADEAFQQQCAACLQALTGSAFLNDLNAGGITVPGVDYTTIVSRYDHGVTPYTSGLIHEPGVTNIVLQQVCPADAAGHLSQAIDPNVTQLILNALDSEHAEPIPCSPFVLPV